jgi:hypothetical protein
MTTTDQQSRATRVLRAELRCYLCAETAGAVESETAAAGMPPLARFCPADGSPARVLAWRRLRCPRCGSSSLFLDEPETIVRRDERLDRLDWDLDRPRRGRPPRWLVAMQAQHDAG